MIDALVIGGGFYGVSIACYLVSRRGLNKVRLVEREPELLSRASYNNQARIHNGYHYPRSYVTAYRSRVNLPRFVADFPFAIQRDFVKIYAIARRNSKLNARQFQRFCKEIGAYLEPAGLEYTQMFDRRHIEAVFAVEEFALNALEIRSWAEEKLAANKIQVTLSSQAKSCYATANGTAVKILQNGESGDPETVNARYVFNCTYCALNHIDLRFQPVTTALKHEVAEVGLIEMPPGLRGLGVTVMDGPFFSTMPFPARKLHSLSHVRYTPHLQWYDTASKNPYDYLACYQKNSRVDRMLRDAMRYMPVLGDAVTRDSLFEVKTVLGKNEGNDGRPILFEKSRTLPGFYSILGGKIDNIYDVFDYMDKETFDRVGK